MSLDFLFVPSKIHFKLTKPKNHFRIIYLFLLNVNSDRISLLILSLMLNCHFNRYNRCSEVIPLNIKYNTLVGMRIRQTRELLSLTREKFSEKCGISSSFLADIERGKKGLSSETLYKICTGANISPTYIILGTETSSDASAVVNLLNRLEPKHIDSAIGILKEFIRAVN